MKIWATLLGIGALVAGAKIAQKYAENKQNASAVDDVPVSGHMMDDVKKAATDVLDDAGSCVRKAAESVGIDTADLTSSISDAGKAVADAGKAVGATIAAEAPAFVEHVKDTLSCVREDIADEVTDLEEKFTDGSEPEASECESTPECANEDEAFTEKDDTSAHTY